MAYKGERCQSIFDKLMGRRSREDHDVQMDD